MPLKMSELAEHIHYLINKHGLQVTWSKNRAHCHWPRRTDKTTTCCGLIPAHVTAIRIPPVTTRKRYATALHEIGHAIGTRQTRAVPSLVKEINASYTGLGLSLEVDGPVFTELCSIPEWYAKRAARVVYAGRPRTQIPLDAQTLLEAQALRLDLTAHHEAQRRNLLRTDLHQTPVNTPAQTRGHT